MRGAGCGVRGAGCGVRYRNPQPAIRNPQSAIRNPRSRNPQSRQYHTDVRRSVNLSPPHCSHRHAGQPGSHFLIHRSAETRRKNEPQINTDKHGLDHFESAFICVYLWLYFCPFFVQRCTAERSMHNDCATPRFPSFPAIRVWSHAYTQSADWHVPCIVPPPGKGMSAPATRRRIASLPLNRERRFDIPIPPRSRSCFVRCASVCWRWSVC